jgi:hypothetical protein
MNFIAPVVIVVCAIWGRWPLPSPGPPATDDALVIDEIGQLRRAVGFGISLDGSAPVAGPQRSSQQPLLRPGELIMAGGSRPRDEVT